MILHKLVSAIRRQDWFQVVIEVLIVIVGIFLGLQVQAWNEQRVERIEEAEYLARLHDDFNESITANEFNIQLATNQWEDGKKVIEMLERCELPDSDRDLFARGYHGAGKFLPIILNTTTIDELNSTGKYQIIQNVALRKEISEHLQDVDRLSNVFRMVNENIVPHTTIVEKYVFYNIRERDPRLPDPPVTWDSLVIDFDNVCNSNEFKRSYSHIFLYLNGVFSLGHTTMEKQREIVKMLEAELERF